MIVHRPAPPLAPERVSRALRALAALLFALWATIADAQSPSPPSAPDYSDPARWLCRPGRADACAVDLDATVIAADGSMTAEPFHADPDPPIDCFYVYPTVSRQPTPNADWTIDADLERAAVQQFARFGARCRLFAPVYRQITLAGVSAAFSGASMAAARDLAASDVLAAWRSYLASDNRGRGFMLIGHSQGAGQILRLLKEEIDGKPIQRQLVSALLLGPPGGLAVRPSETMPLGLTAIPLCRAEDAFGCIVAYSSFRAENPPAAGTPFERAPEGAAAACANPAALAGGSAPLDAYFAASGATVLGEPKAPFAWTQPQRSIPTPFVKLPGLLVGRCVESGRVGYLAVSRTDNPGGVRADDIPGDLLHGPQGHVLRDWGLHLVDVNLTIGDLVRLVGAQTRAYLAGAK